MTCPPMVSCISLYMKPHMSGLPPQQQQQQQQQQQVRLSNTLRYCTDVKVQCVLYGTIRIRNSASYTCSCICSKLAENNYD